MTRLRALAAVVALAALAGMPSSAAQAPATRTVYVTVTDSKHAAVSGLAAADFTVSEGGKRRDVVTAELSTKPLDVAVFVDDDGHGGVLLRQALTSFVTALAGRARIAFVTTLGQTVVRQDFSADTAVLTAAVAAMPLVGHTGLSHLPQGLVTVADSFRKGNIARPVIVAIAVPNTSLTYTPANTTNPDGETQPSATIEEGPGIDAGPGESAVRDAIARSHAMLYLVELDSDPTLPPGVRGDAVTDRATHYPWPSDLPRLSGGRTDRMPLPQGLRASLDKIADELLHQYAVTYGSPDPSADATLDVQVKRSGLTIAAPRRVH